MVNAGSSSLKLRLVGPGDELLGARDLPPRPEDLAVELTALGAPDAVGHRIVHGGERFREPVLIDADVEAALRELTALAPLHQPKSLAALDAVQAALPEVPAVACFDTAFHATLTRGGGDLRLTACLARALGSAALRLPRALARVGGAAGRRRLASSRATSALARRWPRCATAAASTPRWASRRSTGS